MALVNQIIITKTAKETEKVGEKIAKELIKKGLNKTATCVCLFGDLGAGKTTFAKGFAKGLGVKEVITSPTFVILKRFKIYDLRFKNFCHIDCYRLKGGKDIEVLGLKEILSCPTNFVLIEWPEVLEGILPEKRIRVVFKHAPLKRKETLPFQENTPRTIDISNMFNGACGKEMLTALLGGI